MPGPPGNEVILDAQDAGEGFPFCRSAFRGDDKQVHVLGKELPRATIGINELRPPRPAGADILGIWQPLGQYDPGSRRPVFLAIQLPALVRGCPKR